MLWLVLGACAVVVGALYWYARNRRAMTPEEIAEERRWFRSIK